MARVTEKKKILIDHNCVENPVYLNWLGGSGGRNYWLFKTRQQYGLTTSIKGQFEPYQDDIENAQGYSFETGRDATPRLIVGAVVDRASAEGIKTLLYSPNVLMLMNPNTWSSEGPIWQVVKPLPATFNLWPTDATRVELEFSIDLPKINVQST